MSFSANSLPDAEANACIPPSACSGVHKRINIKLKSVFQLENGDHETLNSQIARITLRALIFYVRSIEPSAEIENKNRQLLRRSTRARELLRLPGHMLQHPKL